MTTIVDSLTTPGPVYNPSGTTIDMLDPGEVTIVGGDLVISGGGLTISAEHTVIWINPTAFVRPGFQFPSGVPIGNTVEFYADPSTPGGFPNLYLFAAAGENFGPHDPVTITSLPNGIGFLRKISDTIWAIHQ